MPLKCWFGPPKYGIIIQGPNKAPWQLPKQLMCLSHHALLNVSSILTMMNAYLTSFLFLVILLTNTSEKIALIQMSSIHRPETHQNCVWAFIFTNLKKISIFKTAVLSNTCSISKTQTASFSWFSMQNLMHQEATEYLTYCLVFPLILTIRNFLYLLTDYNLFMWHIYQHVISNHLSTLNFL